MAKVYTPERGYNGISASVRFVDGVGETSDADLLAWFEEHGYIVEADTSNAAEDLAGMNKTELLGLAADRGVDGLSMKQTREEIIAAICTAEKNE